MEGIPFFSLFVAIEHVTREINIKQKKKKSRIVTCSAENNSIKCGETQAKTFLCAWMSVLSTYNNIENNLNCVNDFQKDHTLHGKGIKTKK